MTTDEQLAWACAELAGIARGIHSWVGKDGRPVGDWIAPVGRPYRIYPIAERVRILRQLCKQVAEVDGKLARLEGAE